MHGAVISTLMELHACSATHAAYVHILLNMCRCAPFQEQRLRTIINIAANNAVMSVSNSGHILAVRSASQGLTPSASMSEIFSGLTQVCSH